MAANPSLYEERMKEAKKKSVHYQNIRNHLFKHIESQIFLAKLNVENRQRFATGSGRFYFFGEYYGNRKEKLNLLTPENRERMEEVVKLMTLLKDSEYEVMGYVSTLLNLCSNSADIYLMLPESLHFIVKPDGLPATLTQEQVVQYKQQYADSELRLKSHLLKLALTS